MSDMKDTKKESKVSSSDLDLITSDTEISLGELSDILGVSLRTLQRLAQVNTLVAVAQRGKSGRKYYKLGDSVQAYIEKIKNDLEEKNQVKSIEQLKEEKLKAEIELKTSQSELHQLKTSIAKGEYISVDDVKVDYQRFFILFKKFALAIPGRVSGLIQGYVEPIVQRGIEKDIQSEISQMLRSFIAAGHKPSEDDST